MVRPSLRQQAPLPEPALPPRSATLLRLLKALVLPPVLVRHLLRVLRLQTQRLLRQQLELHLQRVRVLRPQLLRLPLRETPPLLAQAPPRRQVLLQVLAQLLVLGSRFSLALVPQTGMLLRPPSVRLHLQQ